MVTFSLLVVLVNGVGPTCIRYDDLTVIGGSCEWGGDYHWSYCHRWGDLVVD